MRRLSTLLAVIALAATLASCRTMGSQHEAPAPAAGESASQLAPGVPANLVLPTATPSRRVFLSCVKSPGSCQYACDDSAIYTEEDGQRCQDPAAPWACYCERPADDARP